jgi:hypothetical protein
MTSEYHFVIKNDVKSLKELEKINKNNIKHSDRKLHNGSQKKDIVSTKKVLRRRDIHKQ